MLRTVARKQVLVQLDDRIVERLDRLTGPLDASRSDLIRRAVNLWFDALDEAEADVRYTEAYRRIPDDLAEHEAWLPLQLETWPDW
jgi:metal-responsive CopG/Arc/MetJ family transcriptional regulator